MREEPVEDLRPATEETPDPELWIDHHFQCVLKNLICSSVDTENQLYGLQHHRQSSQTDTMGRCLVD